MDSFDCNDTLCDEIEKILAEDEEGLSKDEKEIHLTFISINHRVDWVMNTLNMNHNELTKFIKKILYSLNEYH